MCRDEVKRPPHGAYLVVLDDYLVAQDLAESIAYHDPAAEVIVRHTVAEAVAAMDSVETIEVAFVGEAPARYAGSQLAQMIRSKSGRVVLLGDEAETAGEAAGWSVLHRPFSLSLVLAYLAKAVSI